MTRSKMIDEIQLVLEQQSHHGTSYRFKALQLLELIEQKGMLPPGSEYDSFGKDKIAYLDCKWEPEG